VVQRDCILCGTCCCGSSLAPQRHPRRLGRHCICAYAATIHISPQLTWCLINEAGSLKIPFFFEMFARGSREAVMIIGDDLGTGGTVPRAHSTVMHVIESTPCHVSGYIGPVPARSRGAHVAGSVACHRLPVPQRPRRRGWSWRDVRPWHVGARRVRESER
jgi:hypothetical protein